MGIYTRKKKNPLSKILLVIFFIIFFFIVGYYFIFFNNDENQLPLTSQISTNLIAENQNSPIGVIEENKGIAQIDTSEFIKKNDIDLSQFLTTEELNEKLEDFITSNPQFIIDVLRNYQITQNQKEQEKINTQSLEKISLLNSQEHPLTYGNLSSKRSIYQFIDYNCGYCLKFHQELNNVLNKDNDIKVIVIQMPILGSQSNQFSKMAIAANLQNKFKLVHDYLYSQQRKSNMEDILADLFLLKVDIIKLQEDTASETVLNVLNKHDQLVKDFQFTGTPAIIIGNTIIPGFIEEEKIFEILEKEFS